MTIKVFKSNLASNSNRLNLDKYYTPPNLAKYCIDKTYDIIGKDNISEVIEPAAGNGSFSNQIYGCLAYDIDPENDEIIKQDFLDLDIKYQKGRLIIGNPPYGKFNLMSEKFYKKSIKLADYISFILPISQLNNNIKMYEFDLVHSEDLGVREYSERKVHCCLNIFQRPKNNKLNKKPNYKLQDVTITRLDRGSKTKINEYDIAICSYGASIGKEIMNQGTYSQELYIKVNDQKFKNNIINLIRNAKWQDIVLMTATPKIQIWRVYKYIKDNIPEIN